MSVGSDQVAAAAPLATVTEIFAGQFANAGTDVPTGVDTFTTFTVNRQSRALLEASFAVTTTLVAPRLKLDPDATVLTILTVPRQLSVAVIPAHVYFSVVLIVCTVTSDGQLVNVGATPSKIVIGSVHVSESPVRTNKVK